MIILLFLALLAVSAGGCVIHSGIATSERAQHPGNTKQWGIWWNCVISHKDQTTYQSNDGQPIHERTAVCYGRDDWK